jgi:hypothetical protein
MSGVVGYQDEAIRAQVLSIQSNPKLSQVEKAREIQVRAAALLCSRRGRAVCVLVRPGSQTERV